MQEIPGEKEGRGALFMWVEAVVWPKFVAAFIARSEQRGTYTTKG